MRSAGVVIAGGVNAGTMVQVSEVDVEVASSSVTVIVTAVAPAAVGEPVISPVTPSRASPAGRAGAE